MVYQSQSNGLVFERRDWVLVFDLQLPDTNSQHGQAVGVEAGYCFNMFRRNPHPWVFDQGGEIQPYKVVLSEADRRKFSATMSGGNGGG